jgi:hypothetical protein
MDFFFILWHKKFSPIPELGKGCGSTRCPNYHGDQAPHIFRSRAFKENVRDVLILITKVAPFISLPFTLYHVIFSENGILSHQPHENLYFQRDFSFPDFLIGVIYFPTAEA